MPDTRLTTAQKQTYAEEGFVIIRGFLDPAELADWRRCLDDAVSQRDGGGLATDASGKIPQWHPEHGAGLASTADMATRSVVDVAVAGDDKRINGSRIFTQRVNLWMTSPSMRRKMLDPQLGRMVAELTGVDGVRIWHDQTLIKEPWANPTALHVDNPNWGYDSHQATSIWVALDDVTAENGALCFLPRSHKVAALGVRAGGAGSGNVADHIFEVYPSLATQTPVIATMRAGDCSFHSGMLAHGAGANMSAGRRRAMTCAYMPDGCRWNGVQNVLPGGYIQSIKIGDLLNDDWLNPLIFHRDPAKGLSVEKIGKVYQPRL